MSANVSCPCAAPCASMRTEEAPASFMHSERVLLRSKLPTLIERATVGTASAGQDTSSTDSAGAASAAPPAHEGQAAVSRGPPAKRAKRNKGRKGTKRERLLRSKVQLVEEAQYGLTHVSAPATLDHQLSSSLHLPSPSLLLPSLTTIL